MFNNIIYFILVLFIFNISYPGNVPENSFIYSLLMLFLCWLVFAWYCRWGFGRLMARHEGDRFGNGRLSGEYQSLVLRLSIFAIFLFALDVYVFHLKYWLQIIPVIKHFSVLQGTLVLSLFLFYLSTIWHFAHPAYMVAFQAKIAKRPFIISNLKFNIPILFPWLILSIVYDLISMSPWSGPGSFLGSPEGQMVFFAVFLCVLMVFIPSLIQYWWGCKPFEPSDKVRELKTFLHTKRFRYRNLLRWPIFEGRMMTAGIMGIIPRYRYILVTDSLMEILSIDELKAVMAHEVGHAKYRHLLFYLLFFLGYMVLSYGLFDLFFYFFAAQPFFMNELGKGESHVLNIFYLALSLPILITMLVYFRYVMGFFMRHFERQADTYSAVIMGSPRPTISSLEKIALLSGKSRELPSWHHFSIKERVDYLWRTLEEPGLIKQHNRFVTLSFAAYIIGAISLGYILNFSPVKQNLNYNLIGRVINQQLVKEPDNILLYQNLAMVYHKMGRYYEAVETYERIISLDRQQAMALNNLAWLLVTEAEDELRDPQRALTLAKNAVALERSPIFLDTLAEAYYANGFIQEAIETIKEALDLATENRGYYKKQLKKFMTLEEDR
ncbi:MAG: M48 family metalloprotease [Desulfobacteraceae bacterium]|nr:M48 family metalloprotease [Desulfobacteraceae bacterium]